MAWEIPFGIVATPELIRVTRKAIYMMACGAGAAEVDARDIELATGEALRHAYEHARNDAERRIDLSVSFHGTHFAVSVRSHVPAPADGLSLPKSLPEESEDQGLYVVRKLMDDVTLERAVDDQGTILRLVKRIHWEPKPR